MLNPNLCNCYPGDLYIEAALEDLDEELKEKVIPKGAKSRLSKVPIVNVTEPSINTAITYFEVLLDDYLGLLNAETDGDNPMGKKELYSDYENSDWVWYYDEYYYYNEDLDSSIDEESKDELSLIYLDLVKFTMVGVTTNLILDKISIQNWLKEERRQIQNGITAGYLLGSGGKNTILKTDLTTLKTFINSNFKFLQKFAEEIKNGDLSGAKVLQRISMYGEAITNGYEQAKTKSHGIKLPEYPADGNQQCHMNCRCRWVLKDIGDTVLATWTLNPTAEHCYTCIDNARKWNPLRVKKG